MIQPGSSQSEERRETHRIVLGRNAIYLTIQSDPKELSHLSQEWRPLVENPELLLKSHLMEG